MLDQPRLSNDVPDRTGDALSISKQAAAVSLAGALLLASTSSAAYSGSVLNTLRPPEKSASSSSISRYPLAQFGQKKVAELNEAISDVAKLATDEEFGGHPSAINLQTWTYAFQWLVPIVLGSSLPIPLLLPLQRGGIGAEWHEFGLNIEMRFRGPYDVWAVLEDARGIIARHQGRDPNLLQCRQALEELHRRCVGIASAAA